MLRVPRFDPPRTEPYHKHNASARRAAAYSRPRWHTSAAAMLSDVSPAPCAFSMFCAPDNNAPQKPYKNPATRNVMKPHRCVGHTTCRGAASCRPCKCTGAQLHPLLGHAPPRWPPQTSRRCLRAPRGTSSAHRSFVHKFRNIHALEGGAMSVASAQRTARAGSGNTPFWPRGVLAAIAAVWLHFRRSSDAKLL